MRVREFAAWLLALASTALLFGCAFTIYTDPVDAGRLHRFPKADSNQGSSDLKIFCTAYTNRPSQDLNATHPADWYGFRIVSDCRTVRP